MVDGFLIPDLVPDWQTTEKRRDIRLSLIKPTRDFVVKDERIVGLHDKITPEIHLKLRSLNIALNKMKSDSDKSELITDMIGWFLVSLVVVVLFALYLYSFKQSFWQNDLLFGFYFSMLGLILIMAVFFALRNFYIFCLCLCALYLPRFSILTFQSQGLSSLHC
jgi:membrane-associated HD superfamily phosphohydrolase